MSSIDTIESINREQLATASDRLLLRGRVSRQRPGASFAPRGTPHGTSPAIAHGPLAEGSQPRIVLPARAQHPAPPVRAPQPIVVWPPVRERTAPRRRAVPQLSTVALAVSPLVGFAVGLAATL